MKTEVLNVNGMTCGGCTSAVTKALKATRGVSNVAVDLEQAQVSVQFDKGAASLDDLRRAITGAGYEVAAKASPKAAGSCCGGAAH